MKPDDIRILEAVKNNDDRKILKDLYRYFLPGIKSYILNNKGTIQEAEDIFQDGLIILLKNIKLNKFDTNYTIQSYFFTICKNLWINRVKRERKTNTAVIPGEDFDMEDLDMQEDFFDRERAVVMKEVLQSLGSQCKEIIEHAYYNNKEMKEIAGLMGMKSADVAKTIHYRCKQKLLEIMKGKPALLKFFIER
ncbi:MAG: RNA polymerase sigma factor [Cytophagaceae bacterium]